MPNDTELHKAARDGDRDGLEDLLRQGQDINAQGAQGRTALHRALGMGSLECATFLMDKGADATVIDSLKRTSLHWASMGPPPENLACVELLFNRLGADAVAMLAKTTKSRSTPLHSAAATNRHQVPLDPAPSRDAARPDPAPTTYAAQTAPRHAPDRRQVLQKLIDMGVDQAARDDDGMTA